MRLRDLSSREAGWSRSSECRRTLLCRDLGCRMGRRELESLESAELRSWSGSLLLVGSEILGLSCWPRRTPQDAELPSSRVPEEPATPARGLDQRSPQSPAPLSADGCSLASLSGRLESCISRKLHLGTAAPAHFTRPARRAARGAALARGPQAARAAASCRAEPHRARSHWPQVAEPRPTGSRPRARHWAAAAPSPEDWPRWRPRLSLIGRRCHRPRPGTACPLDWPPAGPVGHFRTPPPAGHQALRALPSLRPSRVPASRAHPRPARCPSSAELAQPALSVQRRALPSAFRRAFHRAPGPAAGAPRHGPSARGAALTAAGRARHA
jgi:hypothetical protein